MADQTKRINIEFNAQFRGGAQVKQELRAIENVASMGGPDRLRSSYTAQATQAYNRERVRVAMGGGYPNTPEGATAKAVMSMPKSAVIAALEQEAEQQAKARLQIDKQSASEQMRVQRQLTTGLSRGMRALVPVVNGLAVALSGVEIQSAKASRNLTTLSMGAMAMQTTGASMGGKAGAAISKAGLIGEIVAVVAIGLEWGFEKWTENVSKKAADPASETYEKYGRDWESRARGSNPFRDWYANPGRKGEIKDPEAMRNAQYWFGKAAQERQREEARNAYRTQKQNADMALRPYESESEKVKREAKDLRGKASDVLNAAKMNRDAGLIYHADELQAQGVTLQKKANELLSSINDRAKGWADWALETVGGGVRTSRPLALAEIQGAGMRGTAINVAVHNNPGASPREIADIISAALRAHGLN